MSVASSSWAFEDEDIAPSRLSKSYVELATQYNDYTRDQIVRLTGVKGGWKEQESSYLLLRGLWAVNDRFDMTASVYQWRSRSTLHWLGTPSSTKTSDPVSVNALLRYKFLSSEKGGLVGSLGGWYGNGDRNGYFV